MEQEEGECQGSQEFQGSQAESDVPFKDFTSYKRRSDGYFISSQFLETFKAHLLDSERTEATEDVGTVAGADVTTGSTDPAWVKRRRYSWGAIQ